MKNNLFKACFVILVSVLMLAGGVGLVYKPNAQQKASASTIGSGTAKDPYLIHTLAEFNSAVPLMASPGTLTNPRHFKIENSIDMKNLVDIPRTLADYVIIDGGGHTLQNLEISLFTNVAGQDSVIKNLYFRGGDQGTGNIAREFTGTMENVHSLAGPQPRMSINTVGGLVNFSTNATFRYCSNAAPVWLSTNGTNGGIIGEARGKLAISG